MNEWSVHLVLQVPAAITEDRLGELCDGLGDFSVAGLSLPEGDLDLLMAVTAADRIQAASGCYTAVMLAARNLGWTDVEVTSVHAGLWADFLTRLGPI